MLRSVRGFSELPQAELMDLCGQLHWSRIEPDSSLVLHENDEQFVILICSGTLRALVYAENGQEIIFEEYHAGNFVGEVSAIDRKPRLTHIVAVSDSIVARVDSATFTRIMRRYPSLSSEVAIKMCETIRSLSERVYQLSAMPVSRRIDLDLFRVATRFSVDGRRATLDPAPKHAEIASRVNTQRETVTKRMSVLRRLGIVRSIGRRCLEFDLVRLRDQCYEHRREPELDYERT